MTKALLIVLLGVFSTALGTAWGKEIMINYTTAPYHTKTSTSTCPTVENGVWEREQVIWILVWTSSFPITDTYGRQIAIEHTERVSYRRTKKVLIDWINILKRNGNGFDFNIYEAYQWKTREELK